MAAIVDNCAQAIRSVQDTPKKTLSWSAILAIVLACVAVVLFVVYFVLKKKESTSTKRVDSQVFLAQLTKEIEQANAQKEQEVQEQGESQEDPVESEPVQGEEGECPPSADEPPAQEEPQEEKEEQP